MQDITNPSTPVDLYEFEYRYQSATSNHRLTKVVDQAAPTGHTNEYTFTYNDQGSITEKRNVAGPTGSPTTDQTTSFCWTEDQQLSGVLIEDVITESSSAHHYLYDHNGIRVLKTNMYMATVGVNSNQSGTLPMDAPIVYANPYYIATHYDEVVLASKHYYMGNQRIATSLISQEFDHPGMESYLLPNQNETDRGYLDLTAGAWQDLQATLNCLLPEPVTIGGDMLYLNSIGAEIELAACAQPSRGEPGEGGVPEGGGLDALCACEQSLYWATQSGFDCASEELIYFYHPDYLGSVEFVTDMRGEPYQFFLNTPFGENLENQMAYQYKGFSSRFRFNAKEFDEETGNYYYGARYYDPKVSVWLSVDALAHEPA